MEGLTEREKRAAFLFYLLTGFATIIWWALLVWRPALRTHFFGALPDPVILTFLPPDLIAALTLSFCLAPSIFKRKGVAIPLAWMFAGAQGYAWAVSVGLAVNDHRAYWGALSMTISSACALAFALRVGDIDILWGPFRFAIARDPSPKGSFRRMVRQIIAMWLIFLLIVPVAIAYVEVRLGWNAHWISGSWRIPVGALLFLIGGFTGLSAGVTMTRLGGGTPLPADCASTLVVDGPYQFIRNPMAFGGILQGIAAGLMIGSPLVMAYAFLGGVYWDILVRHSEEKYLETQFGDDYRAFRDRVRCWLPTLIRR